jgi:hypothetical protein
MTMSNFSMPVPPPPVATDSNFVPMKRPSKLNSAIWILLLISAAIGLVETIFAFIRSSLASSVANSYSFDDADSAYTLNQVKTAFAGLNIYLGIAIFILLIIYTFRFANKVKNSGGKVRLPIGLAIGGWFIPIANAVLSFLFYIDFVKSDSLSSKKNLILLNTWWWTWLAGVHLSLATQGNSVGSGFYDWNTATAIIGFINSIATLVAVGGTVCGVLFFRELRKVEMNLRPAVTQ